MPVQKLSFHTGGRPLAAHKSMPTNPQLPLRGCVQGRTNCPGDCQELNASPGAERMPVATVRLLHTPIEMWLLLRMEMVPRRSCFLSLSSNGGFFGVLGWLIKEQGQLRCEKEEEGGGKEQGGNEGNTRDSQFGTGQTGSQEVRGLGH